MKIESDKYTVGQDEAARIVAACRQYPIEPGSATDLALQAETAFSEGNAETCDEIANRLHEMGHDKLASNAAWCAEALRNS